MPKQYESAEFECALKELLDAGMIFKPGDFISLQNNNLIARRRIKGNERAKQLLNIAEKVGRIIWVPYVKGVAVSGSLSKGFADVDDDIDLFIITAKNRMWIARSILFTLRRLASLFGKEKWFCMNYFVDEEMLEIPEKTIYSAIEIETLLPLQGHKTFELFFNANSWSKALLPNAPHRVSFEKPTGSSFLKYIMEKLLNNAAGDRLDNMLMHATAKRLKSKEALLKQQVRGMLIVEKHVARHDPKVFQHNFLLKYESRVVEVLNKYESYCEKKLAAEQSSTVA
jgi:predicted nucleotidyltransferase